ncbi:hypothetical protein NONO_c55910 [Nocardia nova SH22a]|uniref:Uncharacterized protein n=1 Tax=Nocardia nova SH22a TaxID=1415166 RepID=W5TT57_9NOCA|nr:hypothetical protein NONO_c55910 [Nocardia nova SH22a]
MDARPDPEEKPCAMSRFASRSRSTRFSGRLPDGGRHSKQVVERGPRRADHAIRVSTVARSFRRSPPPRQLHRLGTDHPAAAERVLFTCSQVVHTRRYRSFHVRRLRRGWSYALVTGISDDVADRGGELGSGTGAGHPGQRLRLAAAATAAGRTRFRPARARLAARTSRGRSGGRGGPERPGRRCRDRGLRRSGRREAGGVDRSRGRTAYHLRAGPRRCAGRPESPARHTAGHADAGTSGMPGGVSALGTTAGARLSGPAGSAPAESGAAQTRSATVRSGIRTLRSWRLPSPTDPASTPGSLPRSGRDANIRKWRPRRPGHRARCGCSDADRASPGRLHRG